MRLWKLFLKLAEKGHLCVADITEAKRPHNLLLICFHMIYRVCDTLEFLQQDTTHLEAQKQLPRKKIQLATKFRIVGVVPNGMVVNGKPEYIRDYCQASLDHLGVDYIDLYYYHRIDKTMPIEEIIGELKKLVEEGKVKYIGLSEASPEIIHRAHAVHPISALQMEWSLWTRDLYELFLLNAY